MKPACNVMRTRLHRQAKLFGQGISGRGFTMIELLITSTIIIVLSGTSLVTFLNYRERRSTNDDASAVADWLRTIQIKATAVEIPPGCTNVTNYVVGFSGADLTVSATCPGVGSVPIPNLSLTLANSVFQSAGGTTFDSRTISATPATVNICGYKYLFAVTIYQAANVSRPVYAGPC
ncbi:hypothetical protein A3A84_02305 [Candidatus Collierbacteria bacterium RIFCSPLOWO2_01_FULL_50_23]|uniref:Prepilin-type N-terminal cleavage/methylation domain-containing protein n=1 Tax=Candidatus Collierbacteria bacterium RIFCSPHIGHO2_01_FULL_50_25 TaxID=1817722 RepID=A0A1F5EUU8_9BACT|nr:MAG: hypothetical protein A2703_02330 [Candidatus Collierbacteria bacterium RIFCSPHIGHO2_01_FULL_50_25]OGD73791.1 MAG: hypothetical protein A3A84_02305 [Candidatus Collierbacteria bacterium RIFCSPLOWO2_01_FULL_50_23]